jgi:hypothetical protein
MSFLEALQRSPVVPQSAPLVEKRQKTVKKGTCGAPVPTGLFWYILEKCSRTITVLTPDISKMNKNGQFFGGLLQVLIHSASAVL